MIGYVFRVVTLILWLGFVFAYAWYAGGIFR